LTGASRFMGKDQIVKMKSLTPAPISAETATLDTLWKAAEWTIGFLKERRAALIAAAVTGKIESLSSFAWRPENWV
jgi:hypothetical protein